MDAIANSANEGKTLTLLTDVNIKSNADLSMAYKMGIDLNGYDLSFATNNLLINYAAVPNGSSSLGLFSNSSSRTGSINGKSYNGAIGSGKILLDVNDVYLVGNNLSAYYAQIGFGSFSQGAFDSLTSLVSDRALALADKTFVVNDSLTLLDGLGVYLQGTNGRVTALFDVGNQLNLDNNPQSNNGIVTVGDGAASAMTAQYNYNLTLTSNGLTQPAAIPVSFYVRGNDAKTVGDTLLNQIPSVVSGSLFLPTYDISTKYTINWAVEDYSLGKVFDKNGTFLIDGYKNLTDWTDRYAKIGIIVDDGKTIYTASKVVLLQIFTAEERTNLVFNNVQTVLNEVYSDTAPQGSYLDLLNGSVSYIKTDMAAKAKLISVTAQVGYTAVNGVAVEESVSSNLNDVNAPYLTVVSDGTHADYNLITVTNKPDRNGVATVNCALTFTFENGERSNVSYSVTKQVVVLGYEQTYQVNDPTVKLQAGLDNNAYTSDSSYTFDAYGAYVSANKPVFVEYKIASPVDASNYLLIENHKYVANTSGNFFDMGNGVFAYISNRCSYDSATNSFVVDANGSYIEISDQYVYSDLLKKQIHVNALDLNYRAGIYGPSISGINANYVGAFESGSIYSLNSTFTVLPENVPCVNTSVNVEARLYTVNASGIKEYVLDEQNNPLVYNTYLTIKGLYHNRASEIADYQFYTEMLKYYDFNNDGYIGVAEAKTEWFTDGKLNLLVAPSGYAYTNASNQSANSYFISLANKSIADLKGIEYFTGAKGYDFSGNLISSVAHLKSLYGIEYLNLTGNNVTNVDGLKYMDNLVYLNMNGNYVTNLDALEYLYNLRYIDFNGNNINDISALSKHSLINYLDLRVDSVTPYATTRTAKYYLALIYENNKENSLKMYITYGSNSVYSATNEDVIAAEALSRLQTINEVYQTLYMPTSYDYKYTIDGTEYTKRYSLKWEIIGTRTDLVFNNDATSGVTLGYIITTPIISSPVTIQVTVATTTAEGVNEWSELSRTFDVTLLQSQEVGSTPYIYFERLVNGVIVGSYELASDVIPDPVLRNFLFEIANTEKNGTITFNGVDYNEKFTLTQAEIIAANQKSENRNWSNSGITDLTNISIFAGAFKGKSLNLSGNQLKLFTETINGETITHDYGDLSPLNGMELSTLTLGGQKYDFTQLSDTTTLEKLYVYECYNVDTDAVIAGLYQVYLNNPSVDIYKDSSTVVWDPYTELLDKYVRSLDSIYAFMDITDVRGFFHDYSLDANGAFVKINGEYVAYDANNSAHSGLARYSLDTTVTFEFYGNSISFRVSQINYYERNEAENKTTALESSTFFNSESVTVGDAKHYTGIALKRLAGYNETFYAQLTLSGRDARSTTVDNINYNRYYVQLQTDFNYKVYAVGYDTDGVTVKKTPISTIFNGNTVRSIVAESLTNLFATTSSSADLDTALTATGNGSTAYYKDAEGNYCVPYLTLYNMTLLYKGAEITADTTVTIDATYSDGGNALEGIEYLGKIKKVAITRDANLGDGSYLTNLDSLTITWSGLNLTTITTDLPNLKTLVIGTLTAPNAFLVLDDNGYYPLKHFTGLTDLTILNSCIYDWEGLKGLIPQGGATSKLRTLTIYGTDSGDYTAYTNKNSNDGATTAIIDSIIAKLDPSVTVFTYLLGSRINYFDRITTYPWSAADDNDYEPSPEGEYAEFFKYIFDLGVKTGDNTFANTINSETILTTASSANRTITLPSTTRSVSFGQTFNAASDYFARDFAIEWKIYGIKTGETIGNIISISNNSSFGATTDAVTPITRTTDGSNVTLTVNSSVANDYYFVIVGTVGAGYYKSNGTSMVYSDFAADATRTSLSFVYPIMVKVNGNGVTQDNTHKSMANFTDSSLRLRIFAQEYKTNAYSNGALVTAKLTETKLKISDINIATKLSITNVVNLPSYIDSLDGISVFSALTSITGRGLFVSDISDLANLPLLKSLTLTDSLVTDISPLVNLSLTTLNLSASDVHSLTCLYGSTLASSLTNLDLTYNSMIGDDYIEVGGVTYLADLYALRGATNLSKISLFQTACMNKLETWTTIDYLLANRTNKNLTVRINANSDLDISYSDVNTFVTEFNTTFGGYISGTSAFTSTGSVSFTPTSNGATYTGSWIISGQYGKEVYLPLAVTSNVKPTEFTATVNVKVADNSYTIKYLYNKTTKKYYTADKAAQGVTLTADHYYVDMDPALWAFLLDASSPDADSVNYTLSNRLNLGAYKGVASLRGIEELGFTTIKATNNMLTSLWTGDNGTCSILTLAGQLTNSDLAALYGNTAITELDLLYVNGLDYTGNVTVTNSQGIVTTVTLNQLINSMTNLKKLYINIENDTEMFEGVSIRDKIISSYDYLRLYPALTQLTNVNFVSFAKSVQNGNKNYASDAVSFIAYKSFIVPFKLYSKGTGNDISNGLTTIKVGTANTTLTLTDSSNNSLKNTLFTYAVGTATGLGSDSIRKLIPATVSYKVINSGAGVIIYLPKTISFMGVNYNVVYTCDYLNTEGDAIVLNSSSFNIETLTSFTLKATIKDANGAEVVSMNDFGVYTILVEGREAAEKQKKYYVEISEGVWKEASQIFESGRFIDLIFTQNQVITGYNATTMRYELTNANLLAVTSLYLSNAGANSGITSLKGIEIFTNLKSLKIAYGTITSIQPLRNLSLTTFSYSNSTNDVSNLIIDDFSPLFEGNSRTTLTSFTYSSTKSSHVTDLSFLLSMPSLTTVNIYSGSDTIKDAKLIQYLETNSFKYIVGKLNGHTTFTVYKNLGTTWTVSTSGNYSTLISANDYLKAAGILDKFGAGMENYDGNFLIKLDSSSLYAVTPNLTSYDAVLPAIINNNGSLYLIEYATGSSCLTVNEKYNLVLSGNTLSVEVNGVTYTNGAVLDKATAQQLLDQKIGLVNSGNINLTSTISVDMPQTSQNFFALITARISIDGFDYERMLTLDLSNGERVNFFLDMTYKNYLNLMDNDQTKTLITAKYNQLLGQIASATSYSAKMAIYNGASAEFDLINYRDVLLNNFTEYYQSYRKTIEPDQTAVIANLDSAYANGLSAIANAEQGNLPATLEAQKAALDAVVQDYLLSKYKATVISQLTAVYNTHQVNQNLYTSADWAILTNIYNNAKSDVNNATTTAQVDGIYSAAVTDMSNVPTTGGYKITFVDSFNNELCYKYVSDASTSIIPSDLIASATFNTSINVTITASNFLAYFDRYGTGDSMSVELPITGNTTIQLIPRQYYFVDSGTVTTAQLVVDKADSLVYKTALFYNTTTKEYTFKTLNAQFGSSSGTNLAKSSADMKLVYVDSNDATNSPTSLIAISNTFMVGKRGNYDISTATINVGTNGYETSIIKTENKMFYSVMGKPFKSWYKPNDDYVLKYDMDTGYYYITAEAIATDKFKVSGVLSQFLTVSNETSTTQTLQSNPANGAIEAIAYAQQIISGTAGNIGNITKNQVYTIVFAPNASVYMSYGDYEGTISGNSAPLKTLYDGIDSSFWVNGFSCSVGNTGIVAPSGTNTGILYYQGDYSTMKGLISANNLFDTTAPTTPTP